MAGPLVTGVDDVGAPMALRPSVLPPLEFKIVREGNGLRPTMKERGRYIVETSVSAATKYLLFWTADMNPSTFDGRAAGRAIAVSIGTVDRTFVAGQTLNGPLLTDAKYSSGFFMCVATNDDGDESRIIVAARQDNAILDASIAGPVTELQVSESGFQQQSSVLSAISFTYVAPRPKRSFAGIIPVIDDYPNIGDQTFFSPMSYGGPSGGAGGGLLIIAECRRNGPGTITINPGTPTIVAGVGTRFTLIAKNNDQVEIFGKLYRVLTVDSDLQMTLLAPYPATAQSVTALAQWTIIGKCRVYALSYSKANTYLLDDKTPFVDVDIDGQLSVPNAPAILTLTDMGNGIRGQFAQVAGEGIKEYVVFRSRGSTDVFTTPSLLTQVGKTIPHDPTTANVQTVLTFEDSDFTEFDREQLQVFRYYVITRNVRDEPSATYTTAAAACRLAAGTDNGPQVPAREIPLNILWNGMLFNTAAVTVSAADANQDVNMGGGPPPAGFYRLDHEESGGATPAGFQNSTEIVLPAPTAGRYVAFRERVDAWDSAQGHIPYGAYIGVQIKMRTTGGAPGGTVGIDISQQNAGGVHQGYATRRQRISDNSIDESAAYYAINPSDLLSTHRLYWAIFHIDPALTTDHIVIRLWWQDGPVGPNINCTEMMVWVGETLTAYTPQMVDPKIIFVKPGGGAPAPPHVFPDRDGSGKDVQRIGILP